MKNVYLDNAATTKISPEVFEAMRPYLQTNYGNASSIHNLGQKSREAVDKAREQLALFLNCQPSEIIFTGSATEADNLAVLGFLGHIITTQIEHPAVLETCRYLEKQGVEITYLPVSKDGLIKVEDVEKAIKPNTSLVSIVYANNEIGTIQPIVEIGKFLQTINYKLLTKIIFHTDAVQAANYLSCDVQKLNVDLLTLSAHKIYGPKGVGALYIRKGVKIKPIAFGGHQEYGLRAGTENVAGIVGFGAAIAAISNLKSTILNLKSLRDKSIDGVLSKIPNSALNGSRESRLPNNANFSFAGVEGEAVVIALDQAGVCASTGSACSSGSLDPSYVLKAIGLTNEQAHGSLRLTLGKYTTEKEIDYVLRVLPEIVANLRKISGFKQ